MRIYEEIFCTQSLSLTLTSAATLIRPVYDKQYRRALLKHKPYQTYGMNFYSWPRLLEAH